MRYANPIPASPDEIQRIAMDIILSKDRRARRALHSYRRLLRLQERKLKSATNEWLEWTAKTIRAGLRKMRGKTPTARVKSIADWDEIRAHGEELIKPLMFEMLVAGGNSVMGKRVIKKQERFDPIGLEAIKWTTEHSAELVVEITAKTMTAIREYIKLGVDAGKSIQKIAMELRPLVGLTSRDIMAVANYHEMLILERPEYTVARQREMAEVYARRMHRRRATTIARTETAFALTEGQRQGYGQMGVKKLERVEDPDCCDICAEYQGKIYTIAEAEGVLPEHPNCLLGDSLVSPRGRITGVSKRFYNGKIIVIETASKRKLTCTPNHPVLSDRGFCPADSLDVGSYVISDGLGQGESFEYWKNVNKPASIQEIAESFFEDHKMMTREMPVSRPDFHGDGVGSEVGIISTNRFLVNRFNTSIKQHLLNLQFQWGKVRRILFDCLSVLAFPLPGNRLPHGCLVSGFDLMFPFGLRHLAPKIFEGFALGPDINIHRFQPPENGRSGNIVFLSKFFLRPSRKIQVDNIVNGKVNVAKPSLTVPDAFPDRIVHIKTSHYDGFVYNIETTKSYYIANGVATHNCEGSWVAA